MTVRKVYLFARMMTLLLLVGCAGGGEGETVELPLSHLCEAQIEAELFCHYGEELRSYTLACDWKEEEALVTVLAPQELSGVSAIWNSEGMKLVYEDLVLDAGSLSGGELSPAAALPIMAMAIRSGYPLEWGREDINGVACLRVTYEVCEGEILCSTWFTIENTPVCCEIEQDGALLFEMDITSFSGEEEGAKTNGIQPETDVDGD